VGFWACTLQQQRHTVLLRHLPRFGVRSDFWWFWCSARSLLCAAAGVTSTGWSRTSGDCADSRCTCESMAAVVAQFAQHSGLVQWQLTGIASPWLEVDHTLSMSICAVASWCFAIRPACMQPTPCTTQMRCKYSLRGCVSACSARGLTTCTAALHAHCRQCYLRGRTVHAQCTI
jgi:hypothetical protein